MHIIAPYFRECLSAQDLDDMNIEIIRNTLYKSYLEDFYQHCVGIGGETATIMCEMLAVICTHFPFLAVLSRICLIEREPIV